MIKEEDYLKAKQIVQEYEKQLNISDVISRLSDDKIDNIIHELDEYARNYDNYEYGLPTHGEHEGII